MNMKDKLIGAGAVLLAFGGLGSAAAFGSSSTPPAVSAKAAATKAAAAEPVVEGARYRVVVSAYERDPEARRQCIAAHGTACCVCGFRFGAMYGPVAEGFVHVHHLRPLSEAGGAHRVDPVEDLRPVCPNCHAVLHLGGRCRSIEEVRQLLG